MQNFMRSDVVILNRSAHRRAMFNAWLAGVVAGAAIGAVLFFLACGSACLAVML